MIEVLFEKFGDLLPLLIFIIIPLLGRVGPALSKRLKAMEDLASPKPSVVRNQEPSDSEPKPAGLQAFLQPVPVAEPVQQVAPPSIPIPVRHEREQESLKEHLAHRGRLSMEDLNPIPKANLPRKRTRPKARTQRTVEASATSHAAWDDVAGVEDAGSQLDASQLRQAMIWHEILSAPVSLRGPGGLQ